MDYRGLLDVTKKERLEKLYLFHGVEHYLMENTISYIKEKTIQREFETLNFQLIDGKDASYDVIRNACETMPFMSDKRLIIVKDFEMLVGKKGNGNDVDEERLINYLENLPNTTHLIFLSFENVDLRKKIVKAIGKNGQIIEFSKLSGKELHKWVEKIFNKYKKEIKIEEINYLVEVVGYSDRTSTKNLKDIENEIIKIANYTGERSIITKQDIELLASKTIENNIFTLVEALGTKNGGKALMLLNQMLLDGEPEGRILHMIVRQFRLLFQVKLLENQGYTSGAIAPKLGIQPYAVKKLLSQSMNFELLTLRNALDECLKTDVEIKKGRINNRLGIELLISRFIRTN